VVVQGAHQKDPSTLTVFSLRVFEIANLQHDANILHEEHTANEWYE
jgi:hypothetical protein